MHRKLDSLWRRDVRRYIGLLTAELKRYRTVYERDFRGDWQASSADQLFGALSRADLVFSGDYHTLPAAQRLPIRLLRPFAGSGRRITLALEMLHSTDQPAIDEFLAGRIGARTLRRRIQFDHRWGFDWMQYQAVLEFARRERLMILGINTDPGQVRDRLSRRDRHAAGILVGHIVNNPDDLLFVLAGDWHVARGHLPAETLRRCRDEGLNPRTLIVHQNHEALYRKWSGTGGRVPDVVRRGRNLWCVLNTAPHVKAQSHIRWAAESAAAGGDGGEDWTLNDPASDFTAILEALANHLRLPVPTDLSVYGSESSDMLDTLARAAGASRHRILSWKRDIQAGRPVYMERSRAVLLGHSRLNRVAEEAGRRLRAPGGSGRHSARAGFYGMVLDHGTAFFASRLINPARKCDLVDDLVGRGAGNPRQRYEAAWARFFTAGDTNGLTRPSHPFWKSAIHTRRRVARTVGAIWGYYLYESYVKGLVETEWIRAVFLGAGGNDPGRLFREGLEVGRGGVRVSSKMSLL